MDSATPKTYLSWAILLGSVWGLAEAGLGMGLRSCAAFISGSLMTGVALFFLAAGWAVSRKVKAVLVMALVASIFKMFDALLLSLPIRHGAIGNPIFAFFMEAGALILLVSIVNDKVAQKPAGQALIGGMAAALAMNIFPLVKYATGVPACVAPGTGIPLSLYYIPVAALVSCVSVPLGFFAGKKLEFLAAGWIKNRALEKLELFLSPAAFVFCLVIVALLRLA
jgi:hypothetical protein